MRPATLECDHCGGAAITSTNGLFGEGDSDRCDECGFPGHVSVDESGNEDDDGDPIYTATWLSSIDAGDVCTSCVCSECDGIRATLIASQQPGDPPKEKR